MVAVDDTLSLGTNATAGVVNVLANDTPSGSDIWIFEFEFSPDTLLVFPGNGDGEMVVQLQENYGSQGEYLGLVGETNNAIHDWEVHHLLQIQNSYDKAVIALGHVHAFLTQWSGTNSWLVATAGNSIWSLSGYLGGTAAGVGGMGLAALATFYEGNPNGTDAQALAAAENALLATKVAEQNAVTALAQQLRTDVTDLQALLGNPAAVTNPTFTYSVEGYIGDPEDMNYGYDTATVTVNLGGRFDYSGHIAAMQALKELQENTVVGVPLWQFAPGAQEDILEMEGNMLEWVAEIRGHDLTFNSFNTSNGPWIYWHCMEWDLIWLDGTDIADYLNSIGYKGAMTSPP